MTSTRSRRAARIAAAMPIVAKLRGHEEEVNGVFWMRHDSREDTSLWLVTPVSHGTRAEDALADSNYEVAERLLTEASSFGEVETRGDAWPGGVIETLLVRADDAPALRVLTQIVDALESYPILDEMHLSELEWERNHPSDDECYADDGCGCEVRNHGHSGEGFGPGDVDEDGEAWCSLCGKYVNPGTSVVAGELRGESA